MTLIEILVACSAAIVVLGATLALLESGQRIQARDAEWATTMQQDRAGLARMVREIRQASKIEEAKANAIVFLATIGGKAWKIEYECASKQADSEYTQCLRLAAEEGKSLPAAGPALATDILDGGEVFSYSPSAASPTMATLRLELPAKGTLKQAGSRGYQHKVVLEDAAFMRNLYLQG